MRVSDLPIDEHDEWWALIACQERSCDHCHCTGGDDPCPFHNTHPDDL